MGEFIGLGVPTVSYDYKVTENLRETGAGVLVPTPREFVDAVVRLGEDEAARERDRRRRPTGRRGARLGRAREAVRGRDPRSLAPGRGARLMPVALRDRWRAVRATLAPPYWHEVLRAIGPAKSVLDVGCGASSPLAEGRPGSSDWSVWTPSPRRSRPPGSGGHTMS